MENRGIATLRSPTYSLIIPGKVGVMRDNTGVKSKAAKILWAVYGCILLVILAALLYYLWLVMNGTAYSYGHKPITQSQINSELASKHAKAVTESDKGKSNTRYAKTEQVQQLARLAKVERAQFNGNSNYVTFRQPSGQIVCTITQDVKKYPPSTWIPTWISSQGQKASGPGVVCGVVRPLTVQSGDSHRCSRGKYVGAVFGVTRDQKKMVGACLTGRSPLHADAIFLKDQRLKVPALEYDYRIELGDYSCSFQSLGVTCANMHTGRGFTIDDDKYNFFGQ